MHSNIKSNDIVDCLAKKGALRNAVDYIPYTEVHTVYTNIDKYIIHLWQKYYNDTKKSEFYKKIEPMVSRHIKFTHSSRPIEKVMTRLRLGKCMLNKYMYDIKLHVDGLCSNCKVHETIEHVLFTCTIIPIGLEKTVPQLLTEKCEALNIPCTITAAFSNPLLVKCIYEWIVSLKRSI